MPSAQPKPRTANARQQNGKKLADSTGERRASNWMRPAPEIVVGLVGAVGTPMDVVEKKLEQAFSRVAYRSATVRLSSLLKSIRSFESVLRESSEAERIRTAMQAGTKLREKLGRGDALVGLAISQMKLEREKLGGALEEHVYILRQLKHRDEVTALRDVYREQFILLGVYMPRSMRVARLAERLARSEGKRSDDLRAKAEDLVSTDEREAGHPLGQDVRATFPLADVFVNASNTATLGQEIDRFIEILFSRPCMTPTKDECGIFHAQAAALRSAALGRQVGAALTTSEGDIVAVGMNEVPKAGGGHYWAGDPNDGRDCARGFDQNDQLKTSILKEVFLRLKESNWLSKKHQQQSIDKLMAMSDEPLKDARILNLTEFGRDVHAEISAILTAARIGTSTSGCTLYTTTFPCHNCAKHIVAAGISKVVYIEPYAKSFAEEFHPDSIDVEAETPQDDRVLFEPFVGISPRKYLAWFTAGIRKDADGKVVDWSPTEQPPIFADPIGGVDIGIVERENEIIKTTQSRMKDAALIS